MKAASFRYVRAESVDHALEELAQADGDATLLAGGQTLMPLLALRLAMPGVIIDLNRIPALAGASRLSGRTRIGAMTRQKTVLTDATIATNVPALAQATAYVGHHQTRNRGTLGGSVALGEPAAEYPATTLMLDGEIQVRSSSGERVIDALDFYYGPYSNALLPDEMVVAVDYPDWPQDTVTLVHEVTRRPGDFALVGMACQFALSDGKIKKAAIGWFGMGGTPMRSLAAEKALTGTAIGDLDMREVAEVAVGETDPFDDKHATADYRRSVAKRLFARSATQMVAERTR